MNEEKMLFQLENMQTLIEELNREIEELKEYLQNEINGAENNG